MPGEFPHFCLRHQTAHTINSHQTYFVLHVIKPLVTTFICHSVPQYGVGENEWFI